MKPLVTPKKKWPYVVVIAICLFYITPLLMTGLYAFSESWGKTVLPDKLTIHWFAVLFKDPYFLQAVLRSFMLSIGMLIVILALMIPSVFLLFLYFPKLDKVVQSLTMMPYAIPGVILVTALLKTYSKSAIPMLVVLGGALFISCLPVMYMSIRNSLIAVNTKELMEAGAMLGAHPFSIIVKVILPNLRIGIVLSSLMVFSGLFGEYVLTNLLVGGRFETLRIYMLRRMNENGHLASSVIVIYFIVLMLVGLSINYLSHKQKSKSSISTNKMKLNNKKRKQSVKEPPLIPFSDQLKEGI